MLNYLGPSFGGAGPVTNVLPSPAPGTMPSAVPGLNRPASPMPPPPMPHGGGHPAIQPHAGAAPSALAAIVRHAAQTAGHPLVPPHPEYGTTTQTDGSILLHIKEPNGTLGPVVKVIPPIKRSDGPKLP